MIRVPIIEIVQRDDRFFGKCFEKQVGARGCHALSGFVSVPMRKRIWHRRDITAADDSFGGYTQLHKKESIAYLDLARVTTTPVHVIRLAIVDAIDRVGLISP